MHKAKGISLGFVLSEMKFMTFEWWRVHRGLRRNYIIYGTRTTCMAV